jgi:hypothetical protein
VVSEKYLIQYSVSFIVISLDTSSGIAAELSSLSPSGIYGSNSGFLLYSSSGISSSISVC